MVDGKITVEFKFIKMEIEVLGNKDTRSGFGEGLAELGRTNPNVVALCADLIGSRSNTKMFILLYFFLQ